MATLFWQVAFTIRALQSPARLPEFMARLTLVQTSAKDVAASLGGILNSRLVMKENLDVIRRTYEAGTTRNVVPDGAIPFHTDSSQTAAGVALEFRCASTHVVLEGNSYCLVGMCLLHIRMLRNLRFKTSHLCCIRGNFVCVAF